MAASAKVSKITALFVQLLCFVQVEEVPAFSSSTNQVLDDLVRQFGLSEALEVKKVGLHHYAHELTWNDNMDLVLQCEALNPSGLCTQSVADAVQVERTTNHDVKAIEYVLKEKFRQHEELNKVRHSSCSQGTTISLSSLHAQCSWKRNT